MTDTTESRECPAGVPVFHLEPSHDREVYGRWQELDRLREQYDFFWNTAAQGYWVFNDPDAVREAHQRPDIFSSESNIPTRPVLPWKHLSNYDGPEHVRYRQVLNPWFSPAMVNKFEPSMREYASDIASGLRDRGGCDFITEFARIYPSRVFLRSLGLSLEDAPQLLELIRDHIDGIGEERVASLAEVREYFRRLIQDRRKAPLDPRVDFVSYMLAATIDGQPISEDLVLDTCEILMIGGLDTTTCQLGWIFHHLANHPEDRMTLVRNPEMIPVAIEEFLRIFPIVTGPGRKVTRDIEFHGCPMKRGDMVALMLSSENRDPSRVERPTEVVLAREGVRHVSFGLGAHRCLGSHFARRELAVAVEEWHRLIPDYDIATTEPLIEHGGGLTELLALPLSWA
jgi:cytochrome P450